jgi:hypothetical protein
MLTLRPRLPISLLLPLLLAASLVLAGCAKVQVGVTVNSDGSGTTTYGVGLTQQAQSMLDGQNPVAMLANGRAESTVEDVSVRQWVDGEYTWGEGAKTFGSLAELNALFEDNEMFPSFKVSQESGLLKQYFTLEAELRPMADEADQGDSDGFGLKPSAFIQSRFTAQLPGDLVDTNGIADAANPGVFVWTMKDDEPTIIYLVTESWNGRNITLLAGGAALVLVATLVGVLLMSGALKRRPQ